MLDIHIFCVPKDVLDQGKKIGAVPTLVLGSYEEIPQSIYQHIMRETRKISGLQQIDILQKLVRVGLLDRGFQYAQIAEKTENTKLKLVMQRELWYLSQNYPDIFQVSSESNNMTTRVLGGERQKQMNEWRNMATREQLIGIMIGGVDKYRRDILMNADTKSALGHGIAWGVSSLRNDPNLSPELKYLAIDVRHRPQKGSVIPSIGKGAKSL